MSASEKLKAVKPLCSWPYEGIEDDGTFEDEDFRALLPQIVALVKAAEDVSVTERTGVLPDFMPLAAALTALERVLS